jgi:hypothetical protein
MVMAMLTFTGCTKNTQAAQQTLQSALELVEISKEEDGFYATNTGDHTIDLKVKLHCTSGYTSLDKTYDFYPTEDFHLEPGESVKLVYKKNRTTTVLDIENYDVIVLPKTYNLDRYVLPIFIPVLIISLFIIIFTDPGLGKVLPIIAAFITILILVIIRIIMGSQVPAPATFEIFGCPFF